MALTNRLTLMARNIPGDPARRKVRKTEAKPAAAFENAAREALAVMKRRALALKMKGVALVAFSHGKSVTSWTSRMVVVRALKRAPSKTEAGANLIAIACSKAAEMADTLRDSGMGVRPPLLGEFGYRGGLIRVCKTGYVMAVFSGGTAGDDVKVARAGLAILAASPI